MTKKLTEQQQAEIHKEGWNTFLAGTSSNPYREGTKAHELFRDGWTEASREFYRQNEKPVMVTREFRQTLGKLVGM
ncbi:MULTISPECIES: hypothetical protein [Pseudomonas]|uniref:Uncharacterized protein n=1 Tax=Pseudomonas lutea TaxID=243924 RepID=A0A9X8MH75_9PSED|nr:MULTISPECIES: hypothetical protein [Pseudomonas]SER37884.1 hypothetical protein SAMN05216409_118115 [Pseudomonas lutea]